MLTNEQEQLLKETFPDITEWQVGNINKWDQFFKDARLGRMVRKLAEMNKLVHHDGHHWQVVEIFDGILLGDGDTPEQALEAAGIKDE